MYGWREKLLKGKESRDDKGESHGVQSIVTFDQRVLVEDRMRKRQRKKSPSAGGMKGERRFEKEWRKGRTGN